MVMTSPKKIKATTKDTSKKSSTTSKVVSSSKKLTAKSFIEELKSHQSDKELEKIQRYFKSEEGQYGHGDTFIGVRMGTLFELAKQNGGMPVAEIEKLLESKIHEARAGALSIMDKASRDKKITEERLKEFFDVCIKR
jgi:hypothetical protein